MKRDDFEPSSMPSCIALYSRSLRNITILSTRTLGVEPLETMTLECSLNVVLSITGFSCS